jgi:hypothetical protein
MDTLFSNPRKWTNSIVKSRTHLWLNSAAFACYLALVVWIAATSGFISGLCAALGPALLHAMILYGLHRVRVEEQENGTDNLRHE